jgi:hypothetical protein
MTAPEDHVRVLQARIRERLDDLRPHGPDSDGYARAAAQVLEATAELIEYEEKLPLLIDEPRHRLSLATVRWAGAVTAGVALVLALCVAPGWISPWWLALLVPVGLVGLRMIRLQVHPAGGPHREQRIGAAVVGASSPVTALCVSGAVPPYVAALSVAMVGAGGAYLVREAVLPPREDDADEKGSGGGSEPPEQQADPDAPTPPTGLVMPP